MIVLTLAEQIINGNPGNIVKANRITNNIGNSRNKIPTATILKNIAIGGILPHVFSVENFINSKDLYAIFSFDISKYVTRNG
jgi:hypothetical protein